MVQYELDHLAVYNDGADAVFDAGVAAVLLFEAGELAAVGVGESELGAGVGASFADEVAGTGRPVGQVE